MNYTYQNFSKETNFADIFLGINQLSGGLFFGLLLVFLFFIILIFNYVNTREWNNSVIVSSFICFVVGVLGWIAGLIGMTWIIVLLVMFIISLGIKIIGG